MTLEEAQKIAKIVGTADSACSTCVGSLVEKLAAAFPEFKWNDTNETVSEYFNYEQQSITEEQYYDGEGFSCSRILINVENKQ